MSDLSVLSNQYETLVDTSDKINNSIIAFKKEYLKKNNTDAKYQALMLSEEEKLQATNYLSHFLQDLFQLLENTSNQSTDIPSMVAGDYIEKLQINIPTVKKDVSEIQQLINKQETLSTDQLSTLDRILMTLDGERKVLFRKLRSSR